MLSLKFVSILDFAGSVLLKNIYLPFHSRYVHSVSIRENVWPQCITQTCNYTSLPLRKLASKSEALPGEVQIYIMSTYRMRLLVI